MRLRACFAYGCCLALTSFVSHRSLRKFPNAGIIGLLRPLCVRRRLAGFLMSHPAPSVLQVLLVGLAARVKSAPSALASGERLWRLLTQSQFATSLGWQPRWAVRFERPGFVAVQRPLFRGLHLHRRSAFRPFVAGALSTPGVACTGSTNSTALRCGLGNFWCDRCGVG